ncbi:hypothetical protein [Streptomyces anulatus]|uniref:hypothetical protein n=1 Tax=Streptomyces anulatus TaxID=1892 RepID=UPI0030B935EB
MDLSAEFNIAASTAQKALAHLRTTGVVRTELGLGTFVADKWKTDTRGAPERYLRGSAAVKARRTSAQPLR